MRGWCGGKRQPPTSLDLPDCQGPRATPQCRLVPVRLIQSQPAGRREDAGGVGPCPVSRDSLRGPCGGRAFRAGDLPFVPSLPRFLFFLVVTDGTEGGCEPLSAWASLTLSL